MTVQTTYGSCIDLEFDFRDESGALMDITDDDFEIIDTNVDALSTATLTKTDPINGRLRMFVDEEIAQSLKRGPKNYFRLSRISIDGCRDNTPRIGIYVV